LSGEQCDRTNALASESEIPLAVYTVAGEVLSFAANARRAPIPCLKPWGKR
jgi:hypothetical protein